MRLRSALVAAIVGAPLAARAQAPAVPPPVEPRYAPDYFLQVTGAYRFAGCAQGPVALGPGGTVVTGTAYCTSGLLTLGTGTYSPEGVGLLGYLDTAVNGDARIGTPFAEVAEPQLVRGAFTDGGACAVGCVRVVDFSGVSLPAGRQSWDEFISPDAAAVFVPQSITVNFGYRDPAGGRISVQATYTLSAVPEPSTFALAAAGGLALGAGAVRRRRQSAK